jgi:hypothetical protein
MTCPATEYTRDETVMGYASLLYRVVVMFIFSPITGMGVSVFTELIPACSISPVQTGAVTAVSESG